MASISRRKLLGRTRKSVFHCSTRCVRRAFLCGKDPLTGKDFSHRRGWIINREEQLAKLFTIEVEFRAEMSNHLHAVLRTRPEIAKRLAAPRGGAALADHHQAGQVHDGRHAGARRKEDRRVGGQQKEDRRVAAAAEQHLLVHGHSLGKYRPRANAEDGATGRFWETRFRCRECADVSGILLCAIYVDLNPIRAGEADSPETARYTSAYQRIKAQSQRKNARDRADGWMAELTLRPERKADESLAYSSRTGRRASDLGILPMSLEDYLKLLKWTAELLRSGQRSTIPKNLEAILDSMDVNHEAWLETVDHYETTFCHVVGSPESIAKVAERMEASCLKGTAASRRVFA